MTDGPEFAGQLGDLTVMRWRGAGLPAGLADLIEEAERAGYAWIGAFRDEWAARPYTQPGEALFVIFRGSIPVAMAAVSGLAHGTDPTEGRLKYIYVGRDARGRGLLRPLVQLCLERADPCFRRLTLHTDNPVAARVYESFGFRPTVVHGHSTHMREISYPAASTDSGTP